MSDLTPEADDYLVERLYTGLDSGEPKSLPLWRQSLGRALENWNLSLAQRLIMELRRHELGVLGQAHLRMGRGGLLAKQHYWNEALEELKKAESLFAETDDHVGRCWALLSLGNLYDDFGVWKQAAQVYQEVIALYQKMGDQYGEAQALVNLGTALYNQSNWKEAAEAFKRSLDIFVEVNDVSSAAMSLSGLGHVLTELGEYEQAIECYEASLEIFSEEKNVTGEVSTLSNLGRVYDNAGKMDKAIEMYQQSLERAVGQGDLRSQAIALDNMGVSLSGLKRYAESKTAHERSLAIFQELGDRSSESASLNHLGLVNTKTEEYALAEDYFSKSLAIKRELGDQRGLVSVLINFAEMRLAQGRWDEMKRLCDEAIEAIGDQPFHEPQAIATFLIGIWHFESDNAETGVKHFARAIAMAWNFNASLGQRVNRSVVRHIKTMSRIGKIKDGMAVIEAVMEKTRRAIGKEHPDGVKHIEAMFKEFW
jgi:tetratricopeptide (TPR) repeat protein